MDAGACLIRASTYFCLHCRASSELGEVERGSACVHLQLLRYCKVPTGEWRRHGLIFFFPLHALLFFFFLDPSSWAGNHPWVGTRDGLAGTEQDSHARLK